jgi:hypothetical protein
MPSPAVLVLDDAPHLGLLAAELLAGRIRARTHLRPALPTAENASRAVAWSSRCVWRGA